MNIAPSCLAPDRGEIANRIERVRTAMRKSGITHYVCQSPDNILYLTDVAIQVHERPFILVLPDRGQPVFLIPRLDQLQIPARSVGDIEFLQYAEFPAPAGLRWSDKFRSIFESTNSIGVESGCPLHIANALPGTPIVTDIVDEVRMVKSEFEIARIAYTSHLVSAAHTKLLAIAQAGRSVMEAHHIADGVVKAMLQENPGANILATGIASLVQPPQYSHDPHNFFADSMMKFVIGGPHITVIAGRVNGYGAEVERTFFIGNVPQGAQRPFDTMLAARALAFELTVPGAIMGEIDRQVAGFIRARGYGENLRHRTGHSFGVTAHEAPFLADGYEHEIRPNMVFSIEPGIYLPGTGGFRFSDTVLVTETGSVALTRAPESLSELTLPDH